MDPYLFRARAERFERLARRSRALYRIILVLLVVLGYAYLLVVVGSVGLMLLLLLVLVLATRNVFAAWRLLGPAADFSGRVARALWVRIEPPTGIAVTAEQAPALFAVVEELRRALRASRVHVVLITNEVNAQMMQVPRLGILGWQRNYLSLGLPLLMGFSPEHARAVVAHELAHLSRRHSRMGVRTFRVVESWRRLMARVEDGERPSGVLGAFFRWYVPFLDAFTRVESRENEREADALAASVAGRETLGASLARSAVLTRHESDTFWPWFASLADEHPAPPYGPFAARPLAPGCDCADAWLRERLAEPESPFDTHPELLARLEALGIEELAGDDLAAPGTSAADVWLGELRHALAEQMDRGWLEKAKEGWAHRHQATRAARERLRELDQAVADGGLDLDGRIERACLVEQYRDGGEAIDLYAALAAEAPEHAEARYHFGRALLFTGDEAGLAHLQAAAERERGLVVPSANAAFPFLVAHGRIDEAHAWRDRANEEEMENAAAAEERRFLDRRAPLAPHEASPAEVEHLRGLLEAFPSVRAAYLVRRVFRYRADVPAHLVVLDLGRSPNAEVVERSVHGLAGQLRFKGNVWVQVPKRRRIRQAKRIPGALVYRWDRSLGSLPLAQLAIAR